MAFCNKGECNFSKTWKGVSNAQCSKCGKLDGSKKNVRAKFAKRQAKTDKSPKTASQSGSKSKSSSSSSSRGSSGVTERIIERIGIQEPKLEGRLPNRTDSSIPRGATSQKAKSPKILEVIYNKVIQQEIIRKIGVADALPKTKQDFRRSARLS